MGERREYFMKSQRMILMQPQVGAGKKEDEEDILL